MAFFFCLDKGKGGKGKRKGSARGKQSWGERIGLLKAKKVGAKDISMV